MFSTLTSLSPKKRLILIGVSILLIALGVFLFVKPKPTVNPTDTQLIVDTNVTTTTDLVPSWAPVEGPFSAKVTVVEFLDFQCQGCGGYFPVLKQMREEFKGKIKFVARQFPLVEIHQYALGAAIASVCAERQGKFFEYADTLFQNQQYLRRDDLTKYAEELKLDTNTFNTCLDDPTAKAQVISDRKSGELIGVKFTPSIYINGKLMETLVSPEELRKLINTELSK
ncbi:MAG: thioredoxin domain-containing protein [Patescibacteria group bacterium]